MSSHLLPAVLGGKVYVGSEDYAVHVYGLEPGLVYGVIFRRPDPDSLIRDYGLQVQVGREQSDNPKRGNSGEFLMSEGEDLRGKRESGV
jgi:hypothetical protein